MSELLPPSCSLSKTAPVVVVAFLLLDPAAELAHAPDALLAGVGTELHEQPATGIGRSGQLGDAVRVEILELLVPDKPAVDQLEPDGAPLLDRGPVVGGFGDLVVGDHDERPPVQPGGELELGLEYGRAGPLGARQGARDVEAALGQQLVEVVARDTPRHPLHGHEPLTDGVGVALTQVAQAGVDLPFAPAPGDDLLELVLLVHAHGEAGAVVGEDVE